MGKKVKAVKPVKGWGLIMADGKLWTRVSMSRDYIKQWPGTVVRVLIVPAAGYTVTRKRGGRGRK